MTGTRICPRCMGSGHLGDRICPRCLGEGIIGK
jgi:DnaJ-class molecular chaperone